MRGRLPDGADKQDAAGHPGRRKSKVEKQLAEAEHLAALLAVAPGSENNPLAPPAFLDKRFAPALAVWEEYALALAARNLLERHHRHTFALFCVWMGEFVTANEEIAKHGFSKKVKTVSNDYMWREHPAVGRRDTAMKHVLALAEKFGLTPIDQYKLLGHQAAYFTRHPGAAGELFGHQPAKTAAPEPSEAIGSMARVDSPAPVH